MNRLWSYVCGMASLFAVLGPHTAALHSQEPFTAEKVVLPGLGDPGPLLSIQIDPAGQPELRGELD